MRQESFLEIAKLETSFGGFIALVALFEDTTKPPLPYPTTKQSSQRQYLQNLKDYNL